MEAYVAQDLSAIATAESRESAEAELDVEPRSVAQEGPGADVSTQDQAQDAAEVGPHCIAHCAQSVALPNAQVTLHAAAFTCKDAAATTPVLFTCVRNAMKHPVCVSITCYMLHYTCCSASTAKPIQTANQ